MLDASIVIFAAVSMFQFAVAGNLSGQEPGGARDAPAVSQVFEGTLSIVWGDPLSKLGSGGATRYTLTLLDGTSVALQLQGREALAFHYFGQRVVVSGRAIHDSFAPSQIMVDAISPGLPQAAQAPASVIGTKKVIYLLLKFAGDPSVPHPPAFYSDLNNPDTPPAGEVFPTTVNGFFKKTSWNQFSWIGDVGGVGGIPATDWLTLPFPKSHYANCGWEAACADLSAIANDGMGLGTAAGIDFTGYDNVNLVLSNDLDCCAWGGGLVYQGRFYGATWEPPWGQETGTYVHEMGHSIGLPHSGWVYFSYDSPWDMMSDVYPATSVACGSYDSANSGGVYSVYCNEPGDGYITPHKDYLGWIPVANEVVIDTPSPGATVTLEAGALPLGSATKMIKVCSAGWPCTGSSARYLAVEARVKGLGGSSQFDNGIPGEGVIIHSFQGDRPPIGAGNPCFFNTQSGWALPVDATPGDWIGAPVCNSPGPPWPNYALGNAQWLPGQTYVDPASGRSIQVQSRAGSSFVIVVGPGPSPTVTGVSPAGGPVSGGTVVTVSGSEFQPGATVSFGGTAATGVTYISATTIYAPTPVHAAGAVTVAVTNPDLQVGSLASAYTYTCPWTPTASNTGPYCAGSTISLSTPTVSGATYSWTGPNGFTSAVPNPMISNATAAKAGTYSITVIVAGCTSAASDTTVVVNTVPTPTASNTGPYCAGATIALSTPTVSGATYAWTGPNGFASALQNPTIPAATIAATGTYSVTVTVAGCTSAPGTTNVVVNAVPATPTASNTGPYCTGGTISLSTPTVSGATYSWTGPNGFASALQNPTIASATAANAGTYSVTVTVAGCTSAPATTAVMVNPLPPTPVITQTAGTNPSCAGASITLDAGVGYTSYAWSTGATTRTITVSPATTTTYTVTGTTAGCTSAAGSWTQTVNPVPATPVITAPAVVGAGSQNRVASVVSHAGSSYAWSVGNGTITGGQGTSQITFTAGTAGTPLTLSVTETTASGCVSAPGTATVTVLPAGSAVFFYTVTPCRQLDTRSRSPISPGGTLAVVLTGAPCGIPSGATSVSVNAVVTQGTGLGHLTIYPADKTQPLASTINFNAGQTRANNAILPLSSDGTGRVNVVNGSGGTVHVVIDVNGYFQ